MSTFTDQKFSELVQDCQKLIDLVNQTCDSVEYLLHSMTPNRQTSTLWLGSQGANIIPNIEVQETEQSIIVMF